MHTHFSEILVSDHWLSTAWGNQFSPSCVWPAVTRAVSASLVVSWVLTHQSDLTPLPPSWPVSRRLSLHHESCRPSCGLGSLGSLAASGSDHSEPGWGWGVRGLRVSSERWRIGWDLTLDTMFTVIVDGSFADPCTCRRYYSCVDFRPIKESVIA